MQNIHAKNVYNLNDIMMTYIDTFHKDEKCTCKCKLSSDERYVIYTENRPKHGKHLLLHYAYLIA